MPRTAWIVDIFLERFQLDAATRGLPAAESVLHVVLDDGLELLGDALALEGHGLLAIDVHRGYRYFVGPGQADADVGVLRFAGPVHHAAHDGDAHLLHAGIGLPPERHLGSQVR